MDLGTANTVIIMKDKIVVDEPSIVALDHTAEKAIAIGMKAQLMHGKTHENIRTIRPLRDGVIADFKAAEMMIRGMIKMGNRKKMLFNPAIKIVVGIPSGSTEVERRAVRDSAEHAGAREVWMIFEPMAAALGIGIDVEAPEGNMIVDIGGGTTEIAYGERKLGQGRDAVKELLEMDTAFAKEVEQQILEKKESIVLASKKNKKAAAVSEAKSKADSAVAETGAALDAAGNDSDDDFEEFAPEE